MDVKGVFTPCQKKPPFFLTGGKKNCNLRSKISSLTAKILEDV